MNFFEIDRTFRLLHGQGILRIGLLARFIEQGKDPAGCRHRRLEFRHQVGGLTDGVRKLVVGGPMMGMSVPSLNLPITKNFGGFLALGEEGVGNEESACIRCGRCINTCPMGLMPTRIDAFVRHADYDGAIAAGVMNCMECGACTYACPAKRELTQSCRVAKAIARSKKS